MTLTQFFDKILHENTGDPPYTKYHMKVTREVCADDLIRRIVDLLGPTMLSNYFVRQWGITFTYSKAFGVIAIEPNLFEPLEYSGMVMGMNEVLVFV